MASIILAQYRGPKLIYKGHVTMGVFGDNYKTVTKLPRLDIPPITTVLPGNENAIWVAPELVCTVKYMTKFQKNR